MKSPLKAKTIKLNMEKKYETVLMDWDGDEESVKGIEKLLDPLTTSSKGNREVTGPSYHLRKVRRPLLWKRGSED